MIQKIRLLVQILFFGIFLVLMFINKAQLWMGFIFLSLILASFFGRIYCGWACPINTVIRPINWMKKKFRIKNKPVPNILKSEKSKWVVFIFFLIGLGYTIYTITQGRKFPLPLIIIPLGLFTTFFISENAWHRYLCPWGVLFSLTARFSKFGMSPSKCSSCGVCAKNCPADAITFEKKKGAKVTSTHCILCFQCKTTCPINTMSYRYKK